MKNWEIFENNALIHLQNKYKNYAIFESKGSADSTQSDIYVIKNNGESFYIEAKDCPAQCGQFVLIPNSTKQQFEYSPLNTTEINAFAKLIIIAMEQKFSVYAEPGTSGEDIYFEGCEDVFSKWIVKHYKDKKVKFIITNNNLIYKIEDFNKIFHITAKYRVKKSGSSDCGASNISAVKVYLKNKYGFNENQFTQKGTKLFVNSSIPLNNIKFFLNSKDYMIAARDGLYEIRKLSNTANANVIFSISLKTNISATPNIEFDEYIKK